MMLNKLFLVAFLALVTSSYTYSKNKVSIYELLSIPNKFVGTKISLEGVLCAKKDLIVLYPSTEACENDFYSMGVQLLNSENIFPRREIYGHKQGVYVTGYVVKESNKETLGKIVLDVRLSDVRIEKKSSKGYMVHKVDSKKLLAFYDHLRKAILKRDVEYLAEVFAIDKKYFSNHERLKWLLFEAPRSLKNTLIINRPVNIYKSIRKFDNEYRYYICVGNKEYYDSKEMTFPDDSTTSFCFEVLYRDEKPRVIPSEFGAY